MAENPFAQFKQVSPDNPFAQFQSGASPSTPATPVAPEKTWTQKALDTFTPGPDTIKNTVIGIGAGMYGMGKGAEQLALQGASYLPGSIGEAAGKKAKEVGAERRQAISDFEPLRQESTAANVGQFIGETAPTFLIPGGAGESLGGRLAAGAGAGAVTGAVMNPDAPLQNALTGAGFGVAGAGVAAGVGKMANAALEKIPETRIAALGKKWGIGTTLSEDLTGQESKVDKLLANAPGPLGTKGFRAQKLDQANTAAKDFMNQYIIGGAAGSPQGNRDFTSNMYEEMKNLVGAVPPQQQAFQPAKTAIVAHDLLDQFGDIFKEFQDTRLAKRVQAIAGTVGGGTKQTPIEPITFDDAWNLRQGLGEMVDQARKKMSTGGVNKTALSKLSQLREAVTDDMDKWAGDIGKPEIMGKFRAANDSYRTYVVKQDILQRAYDTALMDAGGDKVINPRKFADALGKLTSSAKTKGQFTGPEISEMSGLASILQTVKNDTQRSNSVASWGSRALGLGVEGVSYAKGGILGAVAAAGAGASTSLVAKFLTTTSIGKRLCMAASRYAPQGRAMGKLVEELYRLAPRGATTLENHLLPGSPEGFQESGVVDGPVKKERGDNVLVPSHDGGEVPLETGEYITGVDAIQGKGHELMPQHHLTDEQAYYVGKQWYDAETSRLKAIMGNDTPPNNA